MCIVRLTVGSCFSSPIKTENRMVPLPLVLLPASNKGARRSGKVWGGWAPDKVSPLFFRVGRMLKWKVEGGGWWTNGLRLSWASVRRLETDTHCLSPLCKNSEALEILEQKKREAEVFSYDYSIYSCSLATHLMFCRVCFVVEEGYQITEGT